MTTIAWDGKNLAGDRRVTQNAVVNTEATKVYKRNDGALIGVAGELCTISEYARWFMAGGVGEAPPLKAKCTEDTYCTVITVTPDGVVKAHDKDGWHVVESKTYAMGCGAPLAMMAMRCGKSAARAVQLTAEFDVYTGNEVDVVSHDRLS
jgi:ATP-dependent protease HslVU (ClpYQ) peptidase subunit